MSGVVIILKTSEMAWPVPESLADWLALMRFLSGYYQRPLGETVISSLPPRLRSTKPLPKKVLKSADMPSGTRFERGCLSMSEQPKHDPTRRVGAAPVRVGGSAAGRRRGARRPGGVRDHPDRGAPVPAS